MEPYEFWIDLTPDGNRPESLIHCSQDDIGRPFLGHIQYRGDDFTIPSGSSVELHLTKPDGNYKVSPIAFSGSEVYFELEEQMAVVHGKCITEIVFNLPTGERLGTKNFYLVVEQGAIDGGTPSESELSWLEETADNARRAETAAKIAGPAATAAAASATAAAGSAQTASQKALQASEDAERAEQLVTAAQEVIERAEAAAESAEEAAEQAAAAAQVPWSVANGKVCITYKKEVEA